MVIFFGLESIFVVENGNDFDYWKRGVLYDTDDWSSNSKGIINIPWLGLKVIWSVQWTSHWVC